MYRAAFKNKFFLRGSSKEAKGNISSDEAQVGIHEGLERRIGPFRNVMFR